MYAMASLAVSQPARTKRNFVHAWRASLKEASFGGSGSTGGCGCGCGGGGGGSGCVMAGSMLSAAVRELLLMCDADAVTWGLPAKLDPGVLPMTGRCMLEALPVRWCISMSTLREASNSRFRASWPL